MILLAVASEIVIGAVYPLSGNLEEVGTDIKDSIELAAEIVNDDVDLPVPLGKGKGLPGLGGARVRVVFADHQSSPERGLSEAERLITQEHVVALLGSYNSNVIRLGVNLIREARAAGQGTRLYVVGKKGLSFFRFSNYEIAGSWQGISDTPQFENAEELGTLLVKEFVDGVVDGDPRPRGQHAGVGQVEQPHHDQAPEDQLHERRPSEWLTFTPSPSAGTPRSWPRPAGRA